VFPLYDYSVIFPKGTGEREREKREKRMLKESLMK